MPWYLHTQCQHAQKRHTLAGTWGPRRDKVVVNGVDARRLAARRHLRVAQAARDARLACRPAAHLVSDLGNLSSGRAATSASRRPLAMRVLPAAPPRT